MCVLLLYIVVYDHAAVFLCVYLYQIYYRIVGQTHFLKGTEFKKERWWKMLKNLSYLKAEGFLMVTTN